MDTGIFTFCWQIHQEILTFMEQLDENIEDNNLKVCLSQLLKKGILEYKIVRRPKEQCGKKTYVYSYKRKE